MMAPVTSIATMVQPKVDGDHPPETSQSEASLDNNNSDQKNIKAMQSPIKTGKI
jgi:hypothetical protein